MSDNGSARVDKTDIALGSGMPINRRVNWKSNGFIECRRSHDHRQYYRENTKNDKTLIMNFGRNT
jgi:hypothetical protein